MPNVKVGYPTLIRDSEDKRLHSKTYTVKNVQGTDAQTVVGNLKTVINSLENNCVGLAATQIGSNLKIIAVKDVTTGHWFAMLNPKIVAASEEKVWGFEGCLSHPGIEAEVYRHKWIDVVAHDIKTAKQARMRFEIDPNDPYRAVCLCRIIQHEIDHLNGLLISDLIGTGNTREVLIRQHGQEVEMAEHVHNLEHGFEEPEELAE